MLGLGNKNIKGLYLGSTKIIKAYLGNILIYEASDYKQRWNDLGGPLDELNLTADLINFTQPVNLFQYKELQGPHDNIGLSADLIDVKITDLEL